MLIELIRGPGSAVYGEYALAGVLNIVTHKKGNAFFFGIGSNYSYDQGIFLSKSLPEKDLHFRFYGIAFETDGFNPYVKEDSLKSTFQGHISNAPGKASDNRSFESANFILDYGKFSLTLQQIEEGKGGFYGIRNTLHSFEDRTVRERRHRLVQLQQKIDAHSDVKLKLKIGMKDERFVEDTGYLFPKGYKAVLLIRECCVF